MLFGPIFFASIGLKTDLSGMTAVILLIIVSSIVTPIALKVLFSDRKAAPAGTT